MKAIRVRHFGGPENVRVEEVERPKPGEGQVLVRVHAASINPIDWKMREGAFKDLQLPFTPGGDFSGVIEEVGPGVTEYRKGDEVYGDTGTGADAEYVVAPVKQIAAKPRSLDHVQAASIPLVALTAWQCLFEHGQLKSGQTVLILGASGGVGSVCVQLAAQAGARVIGTASAENIERLRVLGCDVAIDYKAKRFEEEAQDVDLCIDLVGGDFQRRAFSVVKKDGRLVSTVQPPDDKLARSRGISAKMMVMRPKADQLREIAARVDAGKLKTTVAKVLPLEKAAEGEELNREQKIDGKIVLTVGGRP